MTLAIGVVVAATAELGEGCRVETGAIVGGRVRAGNDVSIGAGSVLRGECVLGDGVSVAAGCVLDAEDGMAITVGARARLQTGVVVAAGVSIGSGAKVEAGTVVTRAVPAHAVVAGNPAQIVGYTVTDAPAPPVAGSQLPKEASGVLASSVNGVTLHRFPRILDLRGNLTVGEFGRTAPFVPRRYFMVFGVPNAEIRGEHAHRTCEQFLVCAKGRCSVVADDGFSRQEFLLDDPSLGLYLPPLTWGIQYKYSADAVLLVFASEYYDSAEYIRDYAEFMELASKRPSTPGNDITRSA